MNMHRSARVGRSWCSLDLARFLCSSFSRVWIVALAGFVKNHDVVRHTGVGKG